MKSICNQSYHCGKADVEAISVYAEEKKIIRLAKISLMMIPWNMTPDTFRHVIGRADVSFALKGTV